MHYAAIAVLGSDVDPADADAVTERVAEIFGPYFSDREEGDPSPYPALWDWYQLGGRYAWWLPLTDGQTPQRYPLGHEWKYDIKSPAELEPPRAGADIARAKDIDWPAMAAAFRSYAVFTREGVTTRESWDPNAPTEFDWPGKWLATPNYDAHWDALVRSLGPDETVVVVDYHN